MAVALQDTGTKFIGGSSVTSVSNTGFITISSGLSNSALVVWLVVGVANTTSAWTATWDSGGTNQAMHLVGGLSGGSAGTVASGALFALRNPTPGNKTLAISWTGAGFPTVMAVSLTGVEQSSDANAFKNFLSASNIVAGSGTLSVNITSATNDMVIGLFADVLSPAATPMNGTVVFSDLTSNGDDSAGNRQAGAATVTVTGNNGASSAQCVTLGFDVVASTAVQSPLNQNVGLELKPWPLKGNTWDLSVPLNPNLFKNPVPTFNGDQSSSRAIRWLPYPQDGLNINLFKNPVPTLNLYDQAHPFWPITYRPFPDGLNPNLFKNPYPVQNQFVPVKQPPWTRPGDQALNPNLFTNPIPIFNGDQSSGAKLNPDWAPYPQVGINPNLFTNPFPVSNQSGPVKDVVQVPLFEQAYNPNLYSVVVVAALPFSQVGVPPPFPVPLAPFDYDNAPLFTPAVLPTLNLFSAPFQPTPAKPLDQAYNLNLYSAAVAAPFIPVDFQKPQPLRGAPPTPSGLNPNLFTNPVPFLNLTPPPAKAVLAKPLDAVYNQNLYTVVVAGTPFNQTFWPPATPVPLAPLDFYNLVLFVNPQLPFNTYDWSVATKPKPLPFPDQPYNPNLYPAGPVAAPFNQTFWPPAVTVPSAPVSFFNIAFLDVTPLPIQNVQVAYARSPSFPLLDQPYNLNLYTFANPIPFNTYDYPQARTAPAGPLISFNIALLDATPPPFNTYDYPRTVRIPRAPFDLSFPFNPNLPPPVVSTTLIQRTLTGVGL